jgi:hypothetical protein
MTMLKQAVGHNEAEAPRWITLIQSARTRFGGDGVERPTREGLAKVFTQFRLCKSRIGASGPFALAYFSPLA